MAFVFTVDLLNEQARHVVSWSGGAYSSAVARKVNGLAAMHRSSREPQLVPDQVRHSSCRAVMLYWIMRRPDRFPNLGKAYKIEFTQFQGTAPMVQAMVAGALDCTTHGPLSLANGALQGNLQAYIVAQHVGERPDSFSVYWAVKEDSTITPVADVKGKSVGTNVFGSGILGPMFLLLKKMASTRRTTSSWSRPAFRAPRMPSAQVVSTSAC